MTRNEWVELDERSRTYVFTNGDKGWDLKISDVYRLKVSQSGTHYVEIGTGEKYIIPPTWIAIVIDADKWSD